MPNAGELEGEGSGESAAPVYRVNRHACHHAAPGDMNLVTVQRGGAVFGVAATKAVNIPNSSQQCDNIGRAWVQI